MRQNHSKRRGIYSFLKDFIVGFLWGGFDAAKAFDDSATGYLQAGGGDVAEESAAASEGHFTAGDDIAVELALDLEVLNQ